MKRIPFGLMLSALILAFATWLSARVLADDETDEVEVRVQAPLDAANCAGTPPTVTLLGLTIDISAASLDTNADCEECPDVTCADLVVGQVTEVKLAGDTPDPISGLLSATEVDLGGGECEEGACDAVKIQGPLQAIDPSGPSVTVLGLVVDISQASLQGADDEDTEGTNPLVDVSQLMVGQIVDMTLVSNLPPLAASTLEVKNFTNEVDGQVNDENGNQVDDGAVDDVQVDVEETVVVTPPPAPGAPRRVKKVLKFHTTTNGNFTLSGLPTGRAKIVVTRVHDGITTMRHRRVRVRGNIARTVRVRLRRVR